MRERKYFAELAGIYCEASTTNSGVEIYYSSYNDNEGLFLEELVSEMFKEDSMNHFNDKLD